MEARAYEQFTLRQRLEVLRMELDHDYSSFRAHHEELGRFISPRRPRFFVTDVNKGDRRNQDIIDSTGTFALRTMQSGMMAGITSPARPWFRLATPDQDTNELESAKRYLHTTTTRMSFIFNKSNLYNVLPTVYGDMGQFATAAMLVEEDFEKVIRFQNIPVGSYRIGSDEKGRVRFFVRQFQMSIFQLVQKFGQRDRAGQIDWTPFSQHIQDRWKNGDRQSMIDVVHAIVPNDQYDPDRIDAQYKRFLSVYYECGNTTKGSSYVFDVNYDRYLRKSGYDYFPVLCPRWAITGEDVWGTDCPGMIALGDIKQLQHGEKRSLEGIDKMVRPPMVGPLELRGQKTSILPGGITYVADPSKGFKSAFDVNFRVDLMEEKQKQVRARIEKAFYADLWLMFANEDFSGRNITAREISERHEEKLLALGPVLEQLNVDLLDPLIDITYSMMEKRGMLPEAPPELEGQDLKIEYISTMAQAQKLVGLAGLERFAGFVAQVASASPTALDKVDVDEFIDIYADALSIPPGIVRSDDQVAGIRDQRAQMANRQQSVENLNTGAKAAKDLSQTDMGGNSALTKLLQLQSGGLQVANL